MAQLKSGDSYEKKKKSREFEDTLKDAVLQYGKMSLKEYLNSIAYLL